MKTRTLSTAISAKVVFAILLCASLAAVGLASCQAAPTPTVAPSATPTEPEPTPIPSTPIPPTEAPAPTDAPERTATPEPEPTAAPEVDTPAGAVNILVVVGQRGAEGSGWQIDAIDSNSIRPDVPAVSSLSLPGDLVVVAPGIGEAALDELDAIGEREGVEGGGMGLLAEAVRFNFGVRVDHVMRFSHTGFMGLVDLLNGVEVAVDCPATDGGTTLQPGVYLMDAEQALWYMQAPGPDGPLTAQERQRRLGEAIWRGMEEQGRLANLANLWEPFGYLLETDFSDAEVELLSELGAQLAPHNVRFTLLGEGLALPTEELNGRQVRRAPWDMIETQIAEAMGPEPEERGLYGAHEIEVWNGTQTAELDQLAAARLHQAGFAAAVGRADRRAYTQTQLVVLTKDPSDDVTAAIAALFGLSDEQIVAGTGGGADYRLIVGADYQPCPK
ncbi:MAG: hypothetical protein GX601_20045 [Anaerolineales bacterium]|nr:hypothetical protein [Anaerolineales bacterium]